MPNDQLPIEYDPSSGIPLTPLTLPVDSEPNPIAAKPYVMAPDLVGTQQQEQSLPVGYALNDAGIPFNIKTGKEDLPIIRRPSVLPIAKTPDGYTLAMPKVLDALGNVMGPLAAGRVPLAAGEALLGSGAIRTAKEAPKAAEIAPAFYSGLERAVETAKPTIATADQWLGYLKNQPGVKAEELATVLKELPSGPITKEALGNIVKTNKVELGEVVKGDPVKIPLDEALKAHSEGQPIFATETKNINNAVKVTNDKGEILPYILNNPDKFDFRIGNLTDFEKGKLGTKFHTYQLPGGENYKEMLLTLPDRGPYGNKASNIYNSYLQELQNKYGNGIRNKASKEELAKLDDLDERSIKKSDNFQSSHWDEPNVLAHIRMNDRTVEGNKTLHLEEIQSDWHQKGRKEGYKLNPEEKARLDKNAETVDNKLTAANAEDIMGNPDLDAGLKQAVERKILTQKEAEDYKHLVKNENGTVPDAPFKKNWDELALKKMIHKAAKEGYEGISWTPGEAQAARYDLSKQVSEIRATKLPDGSYNIMASQDRDRAGLSDVLFNKNNLSEKELAETIGKELAEKITKQATDKEKSYRGLDLKVGGEGMKSFYDKMLVDKANALAKKYGSKVELNKPLGYTLKNKHGIESKGGATLEEAEKMLKYKVDAVGDKNDWKIVPDKIIHYLPLTPELKKKALQEGFSLFSSTPTIVPINHDPFDKSKKNYKLVPVNFNPFE